MRPVSGLELMTSRDLFGRLFGGPSWCAWRAAAAALEGIAPENEHGANIIQHCVGHDTPLAQAAREGWFICSRRGGKSQFVALQAVRLACFKTYSLSPGETGVIMCIAPDKRQGQIIFRYIEGLLRNVPMLSGLIVRRTQSEIQLATNISIEVKTSSFRSTRGFTACAVLIDEASFLPTDTSAEPDRELVRAVRPALATTGGLLLVASTPYRRAGAVWETYRRSFGVASDVLVWLSDSRTMNPTLDASIIEAAVQQDPEAAKSEWQGAFRADLESFVSPEAVDAVIVEGRYELPPVSGVSYVAFLDPAGGSGQDSMTVGVAHLDKEAAVLDLVREIRPPFSPEQATAEFAQELHRFQCARAWADRYAAGWVEESFRRYGITVMPVRQSKAELYLEVIGPLNSGQLELLDHQRLRSQLLTLERRTGRGRDMVDHSPSAHDDLINSAVGALVMAQQATRHQFGLDNFQSLQDW